MTRMSAWLVRASLLHLATGATLGALLLMGKGGWGLPTGGPWLLIHREILLMGWLVQFTVGVGSWVLPPVRTLSIRERPLRVALLLLNAGVLLVAVGATVEPSPIDLEGMRLAGRSLEVAGVAAFGWPLLRRPFR